MRSRRKVATRETLAEAVRILETAGLDCFLEGCWPWHATQVEEAEQRAAELLEPMFDGKRLEVICRVFYDHVSLRIESRAGGRGGGARADFKLRAP